jgi:hypothetical protein
MEGQQSCRWKLMRELVEIGKRRRSSPHPPPIRQPLHLRHRRI